MMSIENFMNAFLDSPIQKIDQEYIDIESEYKALFGHIVPREMLPAEVTADAIKSAMLESIKSGKDIVMEKLGAEINPDYLY